MRAVDVRRPRARAIKRQSRIRLCRLRRRSGSGRRRQRANRLGITFVQTIWIANADPRRLNIVASYALADALTWTMPALVSRQLIVKHGDELTRWEVPAT